MDNRITGERFSLMVKYDWIKFIAVLLASVFVSIFIFDWIGNIKGWEKIEIFIVCNEFYDDDLSKDAMAYLDENRPGHTIQKINVTVVNPSDSSYRDLYTTNGGQGSTILIIPKSEMALTGYKFEMLADNSYMEQNKTVSESITDIGSRIMPDEEVGDRYKPIDFVYNNYSTYAYRYEYTGNDPTNDTYLANTANGAIYGLNVAKGAKGYQMFKFYQYDGVNIKYYPDTNIPMLEDGYLVINTANAYTVGSYGLSKKHYSNDASFVVAQFMVDRYMGNLWS